MCEDDGTAERIKRIRDSYQFILDREDIDLTIQHRIDALQFLEKEMNTKFKNTKDFHEKMNKYMMQISGAQELKRVRESKNLSQEQLGKKFGYTKQFVYQMERGSRPLTDKIIEFIGKCV